MNFKAGLVYTHARMLFNPFKDIKLSCLFWWMSTSITLGYVEWDFTVSSNSEPLTDPAMLTCIHCHDISPKDIVMCLNTFLIWFH